MASQLRFEGLILSADADDTFAEFYRDRIRPCPGARITTADLRVAYSAWATERGVRVAGRKTIKAFMEANGHPACKSSSIYYSDAALGDYRGQPMPVRSVEVRNARPMREALRVTMTDIDQLIGELHGIKRRLSRLLPPEGCKP